MLATENPMAQKLYRIRSRVRIADKTTAAVALVSEGSRALATMATEAATMRDAAEAAGDFTDAEMWEGIRTTLLAATEHTEAIRRLTSEARYR